MLPKNKLTARRMVSQLLAVSDGRWQSRDALTAPWFLIVRHYQYDKEIVMLVELGKVSVETQEGPGTPPDGVEFGIN